jgi:hypothetical protein
MLAASIICSVVNPSCEAIYSIRGLPKVNVPVLSKSTVSTSASASSRSSARGSSRGSPTCWSSTIFGQQR